jgi:hypothetical protein
VVTRRHDIKGSNLLNNVVYICINDVINYSNVNKLSRPYQGKMVEAKAGCN